MDLLVILVPILERSKVVHIRDEWLGADGMKGMGAELSSQCIANNYIII